MTTFIDNSKFYFKMSCLYLTYISILGSLASLLRNIWLFVEYDLISIGNIVDSSTKELYTTFLLKETKNE